jgi:hypothetical protein
MDTLTSLLVVGFAALIHASFQLSVSVLTMLSSHSIGAKQSHAKLLRMTISFVIGNKVMTLLLVCFLALIFLDVFGTKAPQLAWACACGLLVGLGVAVWLFYYRREKGTAIWIPRSFARHLNERSKATGSSVESFNLGLSSVMSELLFIIGPLVIAGLILISLPVLWQIVGIIIYTLISTLGSLIVWVLVGSGHSLSRIQKWREANKSFLQFASGGGLLILGFFVYVNEVVLHVVGGV